MDQVNTNQSLLAKQCKHKAGFFDPTTTDSLGKIFFVVGSGPVHYGIYPTRHQ